MKISDGDLEAIRDEATFVRIFANYAKEVMWQARLRHLIRKRSPPWKSFISRSSGGEHHLVVAGRYSVLSDCALRQLQTMAAMRPGPEVASWRLSCATREELVRLQARGP